MSDVWIGLCKLGHREELRRVLASIDAEAILTFAETAIELRGRVQQAYPRVGAIIGDTGNEMCGINIAAALVQDAMANDVVLVVKEEDESLRRSASRAGVEHLVALSSLPNLFADELEEPPLTGGEMPTVFAHRDSVPDAYEAHAQQRLVPKASELEVQRLDEILPIVEDEMGVVEEERSEHVQAAEGSQTLPDQLTFQEEKAEHDEAPLQHVEAQAATDVLDQTLGAKGSIVTFVSGRGGVGKTTLAAIMASIAASWELKVALVDLDLSYGNLYNCFGLPGPSDVSPIAERETFDAETVLSCGSKAAKNIDVWGPCKLPEMAETVSPWVRQILELLARTHDLVLVDTATSCTDGLAQAMQLSDRLVLVVDDKPGAAAAQARMGALAVRLGVARTRIVRLANRCGLHGKGEPGINRAEVGLETARPLRVLDGGMEVTDCLAEGKVGELLELGSRFVDSSANCLAKLLSELGQLPDRDAAQKALADKPERRRWSFGLRKEAV